MILNHLSAKKNDVVSEKFPMNPNLFEKYQKLDRGASKTNKKAPSCHFSKNVENHTLITLLSETMPWCLHGATNTLHIQAAHD